uniref:Uncharacterized protein n=1 Tax=Schlesneria paludicola TaxID=360056 RepID=A0A7C2K1W8_9PLAN
MTSSQNPVIAVEYRQPIVFALALHAAMTLLAILVLDGGTLARAFAGGSLGYWMGVGLILCRRPFCPSPSDRALIRYGLVPAFVASALVAELAMRG